MAPGLHVGGTAWLAHRLNADEEGRRAVQELIAEAVRANLSYRTTLLNIANVIDDRLSAAYLAGEPRLPSPREAPACSLVQRHGQAP